MSSNEHDREDVDSILNKVQGVIFDVDPVLTAGDPVCFTALARALDLLKERNIPFRWLTNDSLREPEEISEALRARGLLLDRGTVRTAASYVARRISEKTPRATVFLLGSDAARAVLEDCGLRVIDEPAEIGYLCDYIVTGAFPAFSHRALAEALRCHQLDAALVAIEREPTVPGSDGQPGGGPTTAALEAMFRRGPVFTGGMPSSDWLQNVAEELNIPGAQCLVVGDVRRSPEEAARTAGMPVLVMGTDYDQLVSYLKERL